MTLSPTLPPEEMCISCGFCLPHCPTYQVEPVETASPRGRLSLMREMARGTLPPNSRVRDHLDLCLGCRACEAACPSGVPFGALLETARNELREDGASRGEEGLLERLAMRHVLPHPWRVRLACRLLLKIGRARDVQGYLPEALRNLMETLPDGHHAREPMPAEVPAQGRVRGGVYLLSGCVMETWFSGVHAATARVLAATGFEVRVPEGQVCCGALQAHGGWLEEACSQARKNIEAFETGEDWPILVNSAGCASTMKDYGRLLADDPGWHGRGLALSRRVKEATEFLAGAGLREGLFAIPSRAVYDDPCHLLHAQGIGRAPRELLARVPGLEVVPAPRAEVCCGSAGLYSLTQPEMASRLLARKMEDLLSVDPALIVTANPGCMLQLEMGVRQSGRDVEVLHIIEVLDRAMQA